LAVYLPLDAIAADGSTAVSGQATQATAENNFGGLNGVIAGTLAQPGQTDTYQFTLSLRSQVLMDSLYGAYGNVTWRLTGPGGYDLTRNMTQTDANDAFPLLDLQAGTYTLRIDANGENTSAYALRVLPTSALPVMAPGTQMTGTLNPGSRTDGWRFQGTAGTTYYFDAASFNLADGRVRLISPYGAEVWYATPGNDVETFTLPATGEYTLLVEGRRNDVDLPGDYNFNLRPVTDKQLPLVLGQGQPKAIDWQGSALGFDGTQWLQADADAALNLSRNVTMEAWVNPTQPDKSWTTLFYKGDGDSSQRTYSLWINRNGSLHLSTGDGSNRTLTTAAGVVQWGQWQHVAAVIDRDNKQLRILVNGVQVASTALAGNDAKASTSPLVIGQARAELNSDVSIFQGALRDVRVWSVARSNIAIAAGYQTPPSGPQNGLVLNYVLDQTSGSALPNNANPTHPGGVVGLFDTLPDTIRGSISTPGQKSVYTLQVDSLKRVVFDSLSDINFTWTLAGPDGTLVDSRAFTASDSGDRSGSDGHLSNLADTNRIVY
ncbi:MAG TPA: LamG domain-containing protein, partial [Roseateles sp.]|nr:LamG domain-containing protein [Roseateles sp.]